MHESGFGFVKFSLAVGLVAVIVIPLFKLASTAIFPRIGLTGVDTWIKSA